MWRIYFFMHKFLLYIPQQKQDFLRERVFSYIQMQRMMKEPSWINGRRLLYYSERRNLFGPRY